MVKGKQTPESRKAEFDTAFDINVEEDGTCKVVVLAEYLGIVDRTVRERVKELSEYYSNDKGIITRKNTNG